MKILYVTAGAANMYCGSCMRDNALAGELKKQGHDVILLPVYTPTLTDETNHSIDRTFFGGVSVYMQQKFPMARHLPAAIDSLWDQNWVLRAAAQRSLGVDPKFLGEMTVSMLEGEAGPLAKEFRKLTDWLRTEAAPDVVNLPFTLLIALAKPIKQAVRKPVVCTLQGEDLFLDGLVEPWRSKSLSMIQAMVKDVDGFLATSHYYAGFMQSYLGIPREKMHVVPLGINFEGFDPVEKKQGGPLQIGFFARIAPEKGLHNLVDAVQKLKGVELHAAGYNLPEHRGYLAGFEGKLNYHGSPDREGKAKFLQRMDVLSVPTDYVEPKGLFVLEAMACGTPVVQPAHGAFPEMIEKTGGGVLVPPKDVQALAEALRALDEDRPRLRELGQRGASGVRAHYSVAAMASSALAVYKAVGC